MVRGARATANGAYRQTLNPGRPTLGSCHAFSPCAAAALIFFSRSEPSRAMFEASIGHVVGRYMVQSSERARGFERVSERVLSLVSV